MRTLIVLALTFTFSTISATQAREWQDATGKYRVEADLVAVRGELVVLQRESGEIISVPIERLCEADKNHLKKLAEPKPKPEKPEPAPEAQLEGLELADHVESIFRRCCYSCHGEDGTSEGGFNFVLDLRKLSETMADGESSFLVERITSDDDSVMPPVGETERPSPGEIAAVKRWVLSGAPARARQEKRTFISNKRVHEAALQHLRTVSERSQRFVRYFSLVNLYNAGVSSDELKTYRNAFGKLLNSLSWNPDIVVPEAIDETETLYAIDIRSLDWQSVVWSKMEQANPYHLPSDSDDAVECYQRTRTLMPIVRIDWFVHAASRPPLYHDILSLPETDTQLERILHVNVNSNISQEKAIRSGFNNSGVSQNNRLIEWHRSSYGSYWKSYDFGGNVGRQNLFEYPMGPGTERTAFEHDGGEIIFSLPNGLQAYLLVDGRGHRIDQGPVNIVSDPKRPDRMVTNGVSCMSCHYAGVIPKRDEVGPAIRANPNAYENSADILALYRPAEELGDVFQRDGARFAEALARLGIKNLSRSGESVSAMAAQFERDVDVKHVASEFGLDEQQFRVRIARPSRVSRAYSPLLLPGGTIKRDTLKDTFITACVDFQLVPKTFEPLFKPTVPPRSMIASATTNVPAPFAPMPSKSTPSAPTRSTPMRSAAPMPEKQMPATPPPAREQEMRPPSPPVQKPPAVSIAAAKKQAVEPASAMNDLVRFGDISWGFGAIALSPDNKRLAAAHKMDGVMLFDLVHKGIESVTKLSDEYRQSTIARFTPDGRFLLIGSYSGLIAVCTIEKSGRLKMVSQFAGHSQEVKCLEVSADGKYAISGGRDKRARYWEIRSGRQKALLHSFEREVKAVQISRDGKKAWATDMLKLVEYDLEKGELIRERPLGRYGSGQSAAISDDGKYVAADDGSKVKLWEIETGRELPSLDSSQIQWSMRFAPGSHILLTGGLAKVSLWDVGSQQRIGAQAFDNASYMKVFSISQDGMLLSAQSREELIVRRLDAAP